MACCIIILLYHVTLNFFVAFLSSCGIDEHFDSKISFSTAINIYQGFSLINNNTNNNTTYILPVIMIIYTSTCNNNNNNNNSSSTCSSSKNYSRNNNSGIIYFL